MNIDSTIPINDGPVDTSPREAGYDLSRLELLDRLFLDLIARQRLQGAGYILSRGGRVFAHRAMGYRQADLAGPALQPDSLRRIASITKMFTAVATMQLVEAGQLAIETKVGNLIPEFNTADYCNIQVKHLLTHTAGCFFDPGSMCEAWPRDWPFSRPKAAASTAVPGGTTPDPSPEEERSGWYKSMLAGIAYCEPGREWMYNSAGFITLGDLIHRITGVPYTTWVTDHILQPLGMADSSFWLDDARRDRLCTTNGNEDWLFQEIPGDHRKCLYAGGGIISTLADMWRFGQALCAGGTLATTASSLASQARANPAGCRILGKRTVEYMAMNHLERCSSRAWGNVVSNYQYGLGFIVPMEGTVSPGSFGHEGAGRCVLWVDPAEEFVAMYFVPSRVDWVAESVRNPLPIIWSGIQ